VATARRALLSDIAPHEWDEYMNNVGDEGWELVSVNMWNDLFWPLIVLSEREDLTLPVGLVIIQQGSYMQRELAFAAAFIASEPVLLFYASFQRKIIAGIITTGMAGQ
jgi:multiple sugar transport system permease protein